MKHALLRRRAGAALATVVVLAAAGLLRAGVVYVDAGATGGNTGADWPNAFIELREALAVTVAGDEIWAAEGTYTPALPGQTAVSFALANGVALYGGFAGGESTRDQRDVAAHPTILSGDLAGDDVYGAGVWYQGWNINTPNSVHVVTGTSVDATAVLDGFTIQAGYNGPGAGMQLQNASPVIRRCTFRRNLAGFTHGGGLYMADSSPQITSSRFVENYVHLGSGGGMYITGASAPSITDCAFTANRVITQSGGGEGQGGGIHSASSSPVTVTRCTFEHNVGTAFSGCCAIDIARGAGISSFADGLTVRDSVFRNNTAHAGGGVFTWGDTMIVNSLFFNNTVYAFPLSQVASDGGYGAGVASLSFQPAATTMINCAIVNNHGAEGVGFWSAYSHSSVLRNTVVWGNIATGQDVSPRDAAFKGDADISYSCVQDLLTPIPDEDPPDPADYPGCIVVDPMFVNRPGGDLRLAAGSPCIDAGQNGPVPAGVLHDLDGHLRFLDHPATADTGSGTPPIVDMGPYEFVPTIGPDLDADGDVDADDLALFESCVSGPTVPFASGCENRNFDADIDVDQSDFGIFQRCLGGANAPADPTCIG